MKRRRAPISNINVVPYLDVMLVLLVIFMITAPLFNQGVVDLPSAGKSPLNEQKAGALEIIYEPSGTNRFRLIDHELGEESERLNLTELMDKLGAERILRPNAPVAVSADGALQYKEITELIGRLRDEGFAQIGLVVKNSEN